MLTGEDFSLIQNRRQALKIWLIQNGMTMKELAAAVGIKSPTLDAHLNRLTMPTGHYTVLTGGSNGLKKAVPAHLLPKGEDLRPGRKPTLIVSQMTA